MPKSTPCTMLLRKNPKPKTKKYFFHGTLEVLPSLLRVWTALKHNHLVSYAVAKTCEYWWFCPALLAAKVLSTKWVPRVSLDTYSRNCTIHPVLCCLKKIHYSSIYLRQFRNPIRVPRIRETYHRVPGIRENQVPRNREIGSLQVHTST